MVDPEKLRKAVRSFESSAQSPLSGQQDAPVTMDDLNRVIRETAKVLKAFISELEKGA